MFAFYLVAGGKPYYLAAAYPPILAAGGVALQRWGRTHVVSWRALVGSLAASGAVLGVITLPVLSVRAIDGVAGTLFGWAVPPMALTHDLHGMLGWAEHVDTVEWVYTALPPEERSQTTIVTRSYSQAAALNVLGPDRLPRAVSGHMTYHLWGPDPERGDVVISVGLSGQLLEAHYRECSVATCLDAPLARPGDTDLPVHVCRAPEGGMEQLWPEIRDYGHDAVHGASCAERGGRTSSAP